MNIVYPYNTISSKTDIRRISVDRLAYITYTFDTPTPKGVGFLLLHSLPPASGGLIQTPQAF